MQTTENDSPKKFISIEEEVKCLHEENARLQEENNRLRFQLGQLKKALYGSQSERRKYDKDSHTLSLFGEPVEQAPPAAPKRKPRSDKGRKRGRRKVPAVLPEKVEIIPAPESMKVDAQGNPLSLLGYEESEKVHYEPGKLFRLVIKREKWGHKDSREVVHVSPPPKSIVPKGKLSDEFNIFIVFAKFFMGLPLYRQMQVYNVQGADLSKQTLSDAVKHTATFFCGVYQAIRAEVFSGKMVFFDATELKCLTNKTETGKLRKLALIVVRNRLASYYHFDRHYNTDAVKKIFDFSTGPPPLASPVYDADKRTWGGTVMADAHSSHKPALLGTGVRFASCWTHCRRKFVDLHRTDQAAYYLYDQINVLYIIENEVKNRRDEEGWGEKRFYAERYAIRQEKSKPIVEAIEQKIQDLSQRVVYTPASAMWKALQYVANRFKTILDETPYSPLKLFLEDGELEIDNNPAEQSMKPPVIGRKNFMFVGSEAAGEWAAIHYTLMESCRLAGIGGYEYLLLATQLLHEGCDPADCTPLKLKDRVQTFERNL